MYVSNYFPAKEDTTCPGTTATVCLLRDGVELVVGYVGDSRAMLCREGRSIRLTMDHTADLVDERNRIENCGGKVVQTSHGKPRVQGRLEMTRSIGDLDLRPYGVIEIPDTRSIEVIIVSGVQSSSPWLWKGVSTTSQCAVTHVTPFHI